MKTKKAKTVAKQRPQTLTAGGRKLSQGDLAKIGRGLLREPLRLPPRTLSCDHKFNEVCPCCISGPTERETARLTLREKPTPVVLRLDAHRIYRKETTMAELQQQFLLHSKTPCNGCAHCSERPNTDLPPLDETIANLKILVNDINSLADQISLEDISLRIQDAIELLQTIKGE